MYGIKSAIFEAYLKFVGNERLGIFSISRPDGYSQDKILVMFTDPSSLLWMYSDPSRDVQTARGEPRLLYA